MKRLLYLVLALTVVLSFAINCFGASNQVTLSDTQAGPGQTVYLTMELHESVEASAVGVQCQFDTSLLEAKPELSTWERKGLLSAFEEGNNGVWASEKLEDLKGKLCVLAFQIKADAAFDSTEVICTVVLKDGSTEKLNCAVKGIITSKCTHDYGAWESTGSTNHVRTCSLCGGKNTQTHNWSTGVKETQPNGKVYLVKTCTVCKARNSVDVTESEQNQSNIPGMNVGNESDHDHSSEIVTAPAQDHDHDHITTTEDEHDHSTEANDPVTLWIVLIVPVLLIAAGLWYIKKK